MKNLNVKIYFIEELLGSCPQDQDIYRDYIASKAIDAPSVQDEVNLLGPDEVAKKGTTIFLKRSKTGCPTLSSHTWLGFFKEKVKYLRQADDSICKKFTAYKGKIDGNFYIKEKYTDLILPEGAEIGLCERALRANTPQGPIVSLASSETCPAGTMTSFTLIIDTDEFVKYAIECLDKGFFNGHGQWRSGGKGRFVYELVDDEGVVIGGNTKSIIGAKSTDEDWNDKLKAFIDARSL